MSDLETAWSNIVQKEFLAALDQTQTEALLDLLIVGTFADENVSLEERRGLSLAIAELPEIDAAIDIESEEVVDRTEDLWERAQKERDALLADISLRLGDDRVRRHAFRTVVQLLAADGLHPDEEKLVRELGLLMSIEDAVVDFAVADAKEA